MPARWPGGTPAAGVTVPGALAGAPVDPDDSQSGVDAIAPPGGEGTVRSVSYAEHRDLFEEVDSHGVGELAAIEATRGGYEEAQAAICSGTGVCVGKR